MGKQILKKEQMQDVRRIILINLIFFFCCGLKAQDIVGSFQLEDQTLVLAEAGVTYDFKKNGTFERTLHEHLGKRTTSGGAYKLIADTLILHYMPSKINPQSEIQTDIKKELESQDILFSSIKVYNSKGETQQAVNLVLQTNEKKPVMAFMSNNKGEFPPLNLYDRKISYLQLSFPGHKETYIKTDTLFGFQTEIKVILADAVETFDNREQTEKFLIKNHTSEKLELMPLSSNNDDVLKLNKRS